jgi:hypothetical protein
MVSCDMSPGIEKIQLTLTSHYDIQLLQPPHHKQTDYSNTMTLTDSLCRALSRICEALDQHHLHPGASIANRPLCIDTENGNGARN